MRFSFPQNGTTLTPVNLPSSCIVSKFYDSAKTFKLTRQYVDVVIIRNRTNKKSEMLVNAMTGDISEGNEFD